MTGDSDREAPFPRPGVSAAVFRDGDVLLVRRGKLPLRGIWSLPGGHIEAGERALARLVALGRRCFDYVIVDTLPILDGVMLSVLDLADRLYLVNQGTVPDVIGAARLLEETKAEEVIALDLRELSSMCDYFLIASGTSEQHVRALAEAVESGLGVRPWHREGTEGRRWVLLDYVDVVVHVFHRETRDYYRLEHLWADAKRVSLPSSRAESEAP